MTTDDPRVARSRQRILDAARICFLEHGYAGTSIEDIARHAGVVRRTVFNVFGGKEALFHEAALGSITRAEDFLADLSGRMPFLRDPERDIPDLAVRLSAAVGREPVLALRRLLAAESERFPDLVADYWRRAPGAVIGSIAELLARLHAEGSLVVTDPRRAASHFAYLVLGEQLDRGMLGLAPIPVSASAASEAARVFLRAYAP